MVWKWKNTEQNHWGIFDLENIQTRSHCIFCISESWSWVFSASDYIRKPSKNLAYIRIKFDLGLAIFKVKGGCGNFFTISFILSAWNYMGILSQTFMTNETNFLHCTLRCLWWWSIYRPAVRSGTLPEISSDFMYKFCIL